MLRITPVPVSPLNAAFMGVGLPSMVIVVNGRTVAISDIPKPQGMKEMASVEELVAGDFEKSRPSKLLRKLKGKKTKSPAKCGRAF